MRKKSHLYSIRLKKKLRLKGVLILFFIFASIFPIFVVNLDDKVIKFTEESQILYEENLVSSDQGEEIFKLIFGTDAGPTNLDPQNSVSPNSFNVINQVCEGLFTYNLTDPNYSIIPNLATSKGSWFVNLTDTWYTISLRSNVSFHDGTKFNATAVKFTFDRLAYLIDNSMAMAGFLYEYYDPNAEISYPIINETVIIDEYTIRFELNKPYGPFEALLCFPASYILSPTSTPQFNLIDTIIGDLVGTGPFVYDHYLPDEEVIFHVFEDYWAGRANITILKFALISDYDETYDKTYSFTTQGGANDGTWDYWNTDIGDHSVAARDTTQYWCWTDTGTVSTYTGPPSGTACIYPETSSPTAVDDVYIATLADAEEIDADVYDLYVTFNTCMQGHTAGHMYFEYWDGDSWEIKDDWPGDDITTFTVQGPYDFTALENSDFKIRFRVVVGGTTFENDFTFDEVRIYGDSKDKNARNEALLSGEVDVITDPHVSMFSTFSADPDITLNDAGQDTTARFLSMNNRKINGTFRKAISYAINYSYIINELEESSAERLKSPLLENLLFANWSFDVATYNVTKARETMQSMGFGVGWNTTFPGTSEANWSSALFATFNYSYNFGDLFRENLLVLLQDNLGKIGIEVTDAGISYSEFIDILLQRGGYTWDMWELCWLGYYPDYNDPDNPINLLFTNRTTSFNTAFYDGYLAAIEDGRDPFNLWDNVQLLMEAALFETNQSIRKPYYDRIQQILVEEDMPWVFGTISRNYDAYRSHIIGFQSNPLGKLSFYGVTQNSSITPRTIYLSGNQEWQFFRSAYKCSGQGNFSDPYVIEDLVIDARGLGSCIRIENSDVYFRIENCTLYNSGGTGIRLYNVENGELRNNTANNNSLLGIVLIYSNYNNITGNNISNNTIGGLGLDSSNYNSIFENILNSNDAYGIGLGSSNYNTIENNTANLNKAHGIGLLDSNYNTISKNNVSNNVIGGIGLGNCIHTSILNNTVNSNDGYGIGLGSCNYNAILNNEATQNGAYGIGLMDSRYIFIIENNVNDNSGGGVGLNASHFNLVLNNTANNNNNYGISLDSSNFNNISMNIVNNNTLSGINLDNSNDNGIWDNLASKNYNGIKLWYSHRNIISENIVEYNDWAGIILDDSDYNDLLGNNATNNEFYGISLEGSYSNSILSNTISNNTYGIYSVNSRCNEVLGNFFSGNGEDIYGNPESCPTYYPVGNSGLITLVTVIVIIIIIVIGGMLVIRNRNIPRKQVISDEYFHRIEPEPIVQEEVEEVVVPPKIAPEPIPPAEVEVEVVVPPKVALEPIPPAEVEVEVVVPPKVALEPIPPAEVEEEVVPPKFAPEPIPPAEVVEEAPIEKVIIGNVAKVFEGHMKGVASVAFSPSGKYIVSGSKDKTIKIWEILTGKLVRTLIGHKKYVNSVIVSYDGKYIISCSNDETVKVWEFSTGELIRTLEGHTWYILAVAVSPDGTYIVSSSYDKEIKVWDLATGDLLKTLKGHRKEVGSVAISPDNKYIVSGSGDKIVKVWELSTGELIRTLKGHKKSVNSVIISPDGKHIISGSGDKTVKVWDFSTGELIRTLEGHTWYILAVAISPDGTYVVSSSFDKEIKVWDLVTGNLVITLKGHRKEAESVAISPDCKYIVSGSNDKTIKIWRVK